MDRLSSREGGQGEMMPPRFANLNPAMANYVSSNDVPVGDKLQRQLFSSIPSSLSHQRHFTGSASEYGATPDSTYGSNSVRGKPSTGRRSLYNGSNASTMSTVARAVGGIQLDTRSEASLPRSEYLMSAATETENWTQGMIGYDQRMTSDDPWETTLTALDTAELFSMPDINDSQSVEGGTDNLIELHSVHNERGFTCTLCPKESAKVTQTRSVMLKHLRAHVKPFKCNVDGCKMAQIGFANETDLKRHHTSCHQDIRTLSEYFKCRHCFGKGKDKPWTRWDNLKKHILDVHGIKETERDKYRVRNTGPLESDLAGIGLPVEPNIAQSPALDNDSSTIELDEVSELHRLMADATFPGVSAESLPQARKGFSGPSRIMPSSVRSNRSTLLNEAFEHSTAPPRSVASSIVTPSQVSSSVPVIGQQRPNTFLPSHQFSFLFGNLPGPRRPPRVLNQPTPVNNSPKTRDTLHGNSSLPKFLRPGAPTERALPKNDVHRGYINPSQSLHVGFDVSALFRSGDEPWNSLSHLAAHASTGKGVPADVDNHDKGDSGGQFQLEDTISEATPIDTGNDFDVGPGDGTADSVQESLQGSKEPQKSAEPQESPNLHESGESRQTLRAAQGSPKSKQAETSSCIDLTGPDAESDHGSVDEPVAPDVNETPTTSDAVVVDDVAFDQLSDDHLQTVLRRLKTNGRLEKLGFRLSEVEVPVSPAKRSVRSVRSDQTATKETEQFACTHDECSASFVTKSSLRKHEKRHERPFACTFSCTIKGNDAKVFGSKNDWKRHEEGIHFQRAFPGEEWQCGETIDTMDQSVQIYCRTVFKSASAYQEHLTSQHGYKEDDKKALRDKTARHRALPADKCSYWCGFCKKHVTVADRTQPAILKAYGANNDADGGATEILAADNDDLHEAVGAAKEPATKHKLCRDGYILFSEFLSERFNHIDNHFEGRGGLKKNIAQWAHDNTLHNTLRSNSSIVDTGTGETANGHASYDDDTALRKRHHGDDQPPGSKRSKSSGRKAKTTTFWLCCSCGLVYSTALSTTCVQCDHKKCSNCTCE